MLSGSELDKLAAILKIKESTMQAAIKRIRPILNSCLVARWFTPETRVRPKVLTNTRFPYVGLLTDAMSVQIYHSRLPFAEAKIFFDSKNGYYALKKEVAVTADAPHYALFSQPGAVGSKHDYATFKEAYKTYLPYLQKTLQERQVLGGDSKLGDVIRSRLCWTSGGYAWSSEDDSEKGNTHPCRDTTKRGTGPLACAR